MELEMEKVDPFQYFDTMNRATKGYAKLLDPICKQYELTRNELDVLLFLSNNPGYDRAVDIVNRRGISKSHVSLSITNLEARGLLLRQEDSEDRRTVHLKLTADAIPIADTGRMAQKRFFQYLHKGVTKQQLEAVMDMARKVSENIQNIEEIL